jgi:hypothetical protein
VNSRADGQCFFLCNRYDDVGRNFEGSGFGIGLQVVGGGDGHVTGEVNGRFHSFMQVLRVGCQGEDGDPMNSYL